MIFDISKKIINGIINIWYSRKLKIALLIVVMSNVIEFYKMDPGMTKAILIFFSVPVFLFFAGAANCKKNNIAEYKNYDYVDFDKTQEPCIDKIERKTVNTTVTTETIYFKNMNAKLLNNFNWGDENNND